MGDFDGRVRYLHWGIQQLCADTREPGDPGGYLCSRMPTEAGAVNLRYHAATKEDRGIYRHHDASSEPGLTEDFSNFSPRRR